MTPQKQTLSHYCDRDGINLRTAQTHRLKLQIGEIFGRTFALTEKEWKRIKASIDAARPGNPNWRKKS